MVVGGFRWFLVVPCFSTYDSLNSSVSWADFFLFCGGHTRLDFT